MNARELTVGHLVKNMLSKKFGLVCWSNYVSEEKCIVFFDTNVIVPVNDCFNEYEDCGKFNLEFQEKVTTTLSITASV